MNKTKNTSEAFDLTLSNLDMDFTAQDLDMIEEAEVIPEAAPSARELTDEIKSFRQKNKEFSATNDHETYLIVCFSTKEDKNNFLKNVQLADKNTLIDGYELAKNINVEPQKPAFKLRAPLDK